MTTPAWIGLGSNLGDRREILDAAVADLAEVPGVVVRAVSPYHETSPVGGPPGQGPFLNAAAHLETTLDPRQLLAALQGVEERAGRVRTVRWGERTLDLDILIYATKFLDTEELKLPHPRLAFRRFVLAPLAEIAPTIVDTMTKRTIADLLANLDRRPRHLALEGPTGPLKSTVFRRLVEELPALGAEWGDLYPDLDRFSDPLRGYLDFFGRKVEALQVDRWARASPSPRWLVADYLLEVEMSRHYANPTWVPISRFPTAADHSAHLEGMERIRESAKQAARPTLVIALPGESSISRKPGVMAIPLLWPESDKPDAIVVEVVATCRGIEGV